MLSRFILFLCHVSYVASFSSAHSLACVARIPIHLSCHVHDDGEHDEQRNCTHEQRVILLTQRDVEKQVNASQSCADHERTDAAAEEKTAVPCYQQCGRGSGDEISPSESDEFRNRQQHKVKQTERGDR